ncbi:MAG: sensor histidine kinase [Lachnospiraceae bacterium]|nr:sensor histidine kinase [Lachnospiraceae bacterium]
MEQLISQTSVNIETYLRNMRLISDTIYLRKLKESDLSEGGLDEWMHVLYEENKDSIIGISCYDGDGRIIAGVPFVEEKEGIEARTQDWFLGAVKNGGEFYLSIPHIQNLYVPISYAYPWVVSLSREVEILEGGTLRKGVLLIDMDYTAIEKLLKRVNRNQQRQYVYLCDSSGQIIFHPKQNRINAGIYKENSIVEGGFQNGTKRDRYFGEERLVTVRTVKNTDWKIVCVTLERNIWTGLYESTYYFILLVVVSILAALVLNFLVSMWITIPLEKLTDSVKVADDGNLDPDIYVGGNTEVRYLGQTLKDAAGKMRALWEDFKREEAERQKSTFEALQSQINPHFLYNTLDSIVWMIEGEQYRDAVGMVRNLASLFRISLSRGKTIISIEDEIRHARNYMDIQKMRYHDAFTVEFEVDPAILQASTVKLILQPVLENAIEYGVSQMDGEGEIFVRGEIKDGEICLCVSDNGLGMEEEVAERLLTDRPKKTARGSGVGLLNVHRRLQLYFGEEYGLSIESAPDEGTQVGFHLPFKPLEQKEAKEYEGKGR